MRVTVDVDAAAAWLRGGGIVAFPTDTVYGLAVDPSSDAAVAALFDLKGRDASRAIPLLAASLAQLRACGGELAGQTAALAAAFWPGPLSLLIDAPPTVAPAVRGDGAVAVRVPAHALARAFALACGTWITATSANRSGATPAIAPDDLGGPPNGPPGSSIGDDPRVVVLDGGDAPGGAASTIVDARLPGRPVLVRAGAIAWDRVLRSLHE